MVPFVVFLLVVVIVVVVVLCVLHRRQRQRDKSLMMVFDRTDAANPVLEMQTIEAQSVTVSSVLSRLDTTVWGII